jgi:hypothetical protein
MKKLILLVVVSIIASISADDCKAQYDYLKFGDFGVTSVSPLSFTSVMGSVWVDVQNPQVGFSVTEVYGKLYCNGRALIEGKADDYYVPNGNGRLNLTGVASLCPGVSIIDVLGLLFFNPEEYTVDIKAIITDDGAAPVVKEVKDIPILTLLKKDETANAENNESTDSK